MAAKPIKVSQLNGYIKRVLQMDPLLGNIAVRGEISNLKFHGSGHVYFTLKDEKSKISCFLPSDNLSRLHFQMTEGMQVIVYGYIYLYERGGSYSINVRTIEPDGMGSLAIAFEELKRKLEARGYFDPAHKKRIPEFPEKVALITSDTGAAIEDMLRVIKLRNNLVDILIVPCLVQGPNAAADIAAAIREVNDIAADVDVIITGRGGGSMEELWAFNEEIVAEAIYESDIPVISAVGHETDFTIADFVADLRAQTPTEAASLAVPDISELRNALNEHMISMDKDIEMYLGRLELKIRRTDIDVLTESLIRDIEKKTYEISTITGDMSVNMDNIITDYMVRMDRAKDILDNLNPESLMDKGYAVVTKDGHLVSGIDDIEKNDSITIHMKDGSVETKVSDIRRK